MWSLACLFVFLLFFIREWRRRWRLRAGNWGLWSRHSGTGLETTLETKRLGSGDDSGDLADGEWRRHWRLGNWGMGTTLETLWLGSGDGTGDGTGDSAAGDWRRNWILQADLSSPGLPANMVPMSHVADATSSLQRTGLWLTSYSWYPSYASANQSRQGTRKSSPCHLSQTRWYGSNGNGTGSWC